MVHHTDSDGKPLGSGHPLKNRDAHRSLFPLGTTLNRIKSAHMLSITQFVSQKAGCENQQNWSPTPSRSHQLAKSNEAQSASHQRLRGQWKLSLSPLHTPKLSQTPHRNRGKKGLKVAFQEVQSRFTYSQGGVWAGKGPRISTSSSLDWQQLDS